MNTYRVLLTRARYDTVIFVPRGDTEDGTRDPALPMMGIAELSSGCAGGTRHWEDDDAYTDAAFISRA